MKTALLQLSVSDDPEQNLQETRRFLRIAVSEGARFILTPEVTNCITTDPAQRARVLHTEAADPTLAALQAEARTHGIWVLIGSLALKTEDAGGRLANRQFLIAPDGTIAARYDKIHMFDVAIGPGETYQESATYKAGTQAVVARMGDRTLGLGICYDMRFAHLASALVTAGAQVLLYPSAFSPVTGAAHWHALLRARAIEAGAWVLAPAQVGHHAGSGRRTYGHSLVVDPWGTVICDLGAVPGYGIFDLELAAVDDARRRIPVLQNKRQFDVPSPLGS